MELLNVFPEKSRCAPEITTVEERASEEGLLPSLDIEGDIY